MKKKYAKNNEKTINSSKSTIIPYTTNQTFNGIQNFDKLDQKNSNLKIIPKKDKNVSINLEDNSEKEGTIYNNLNNYIKNKSSINDALKLVNCHDENIEYIQQTDEYYIIFYDIKIIFRDKIYSKLFEIKIDGIISCICYAKENGVKSIIICKSDGIFQLLIENGIFQNELITLSDMELELIIPIEEKKYLISNKTGTYIYNDSITLINNKRLKNENRISEKTYKIGNIIDKRILILLGNNNLDIFDLLTKTKKYKISICNKLYIYSYILSYNFQLLIEPEENKSNKIFLLCYKNRILFILIIKDQNEYKYKDFLQIIDDFEIDCVYHIKYSKNKIIKALIENIDDKEINENEYILLGGTTNLNEYIIKLYKLKIIQNEIIFKHIEDILLGQYESKIKCMTQLDINLHLIIGFDKNNKTIEFSFLNDEDNSKNEIVKKYHNDFYNEINNFADKNLDATFNINHTFDFSTKNIYQLNNGFLLHYDEYNIFITDKNHNKTKNNNNKNSKINYFCEIEENKKIFNIICKSDGIYKLLINNDKGLLQKVNDAQLFLLLKLKSYYIISTKNGTFYYKGSLLEPDLLNKIHRISQNIYKIGIILNQNIAVLMKNDSERAHLNIIFECNSILIIKNINYFILSQNCLKVINENIIVCGYQKKNIRENGIVLYKLNLEDSEKKHNEVFYEIKDFTIKCICPIKDLKKSCNIEILNDVDNNKKYVYTNYCFIGGFSTDSNINIDVNIKLLVIYGIEGNFSPVINILANIVYLNVIENPITCIIQSMNNGNILICCNNENNKELICNRSEFDDISMDYPYDLEDDYPFI